MASRRRTPDETITNLCEAEVELAQGRSPAPERGRSCSTEGLGIQLRPTYRKHMRVYDRGPEPALRSYERRSMPRAANDGNPLPWMHYWVAREQPARARRVRPA